MYYPLVEDEEDDIESYWGELSTPVKRKIPLPGDYHKGLPLFSQPPTFYIGLHSNLGELPLARQVLPPIIDGKNSADINFETSHLNVTFEATRLAIYDALSGGKALLLSPLAVTAPVSFGVALRISQGSLSFEGLARRLLESTF